MFADTHDVFYISIETVSTRIKDLYIAIYAIQVFFFQHQIKTELQQLEFNYQHMHKNSGFFSH